MGKESFNRIIDALEVRCVLVSRRKVIKSSELINTVEQKDVLVRVEQGFFSADLTHEQIHAGSFYFVPCGNFIQFRHGLAPYSIIGPEGFESKEDRELYLKPISIEEKVNTDDSVFSIFGFDIMIHGVIPFFSIIDLPCIRIEFNSKISAILDRMMEENEKEEIGKITIINKMAHELVIYICRFLYDNPKFSPNVLKLAFLLDKRLIAIIQYIEENLDKDLANHHIAKLAFVSKDYIGQFFKSLTNHNLQDYIENRRLDKAHFFLRTTNDNIQSIAHKVGFKDPAYFSRRFKIRFGQNAKEIRKRDFL